MEDIKEEMINGLEIVKKENEFTIKRC